MNKQRKVLITITYNEMGIIIDTKAEEVAQPELAQDLHSTCADAISRQAAIDAADRADYTGLAIEDVKKVTDEVVKEIKNLPPTDTDLSAYIDKVWRTAYERGKKEGRKRGKWELIDDTEFRVPGYWCSACHCECEDWESKPTYNYCPHCGADMRGGDEE